MAGLLERGLTVHDAMISDKTMPVMTDSDFDKSIKNDAYQRAFHAHCQLAVSYWDEEGPIFMPNEGQKRIKDISPQF